MKRKYPPCQWFFLESAAAQRKSVRYSSSTLHNVVTHKIMFYWVTRMTKLGLTSTLPSTLSQDYLHPWDPIYYQKVIIMKSEQYHYPITKKDESLRNFHYVLLTVVFAHLFCTISFSLQVEHFCLHILALSFSIPKKWHTPKPFLAAPKL